MKKIGIVTIHSDLHYGAALQAFALCAYLRNTGYNASIINYIKIPNVKYIYPFPQNIAYKIMNYPRFKRYRSFLSTMITHKTYNNVEEFQNITEDFDILCTGSDQVWNPKCGGLNALNPVYFLDTPKKQYKKISYAASLGAYKYSTEEATAVKKWINNYQHISVREEFTRDEIKRVSNYNQDIPIVIDPTFLLGSKALSLECNKINIGKPYILLYHLNNISLILQFAQHLKKKTGWEIIMMSNNLRKLKGVDKNIHFCGPREFIGLIKNANYILTDSFHGTAFAINFRRNFASILKTDNPYRSKSLLDKAMLGSRLIKNINEFDNLPIETDYSNITNLQKHIEQSKKILLSFIEN